MGDVCGAGDQARDLIHAKQGSASELGPQPQKVRSFKHTEMQIIVKTPISIVTLSSV